MRSPRWPPGWFAKMPCRNWLSETAAAELADFVAVRPIGPCV